MNLKRYRHFLFENLLSEVRTATHVLATGMTQHDGRIVGIIAVTNTNMKMKTKTNNSRHAETTSPIPPPPTSITPKTHVKVSNGEP